MSIKLLSAAALSLALMGGAAYAQATSSTSSDNPSQNTASDAVILGNKDKMGAFYTDESMATLKTDDEMRTAWSGLTAEDQTAFRSECQALTQQDSEAATTDPMSPSVQEFCGKIGAF
ncbi:MAG: hypothetical protein KF723_16665 [Rhizobiaceae bacterium]|nr:hypothetical protein [Rhizobiaceae bacterium]